MKSRESVSSGIGRRVRGNCDGAGMSRRGGEADALNSCGQDAQSSDFVGEEFNYNGCAANAGELLDSQILCEMDGVNTDGKQ